MMVARTLAEEVTALNAEILALEPVRQKIWDQWQVLQRVHVDAETDPKETVEAALLSYMQFAQFCESFLPNPLPAWLHQTEMNVSDAPHAYFQRIARAARWEAQHLRSRLEQAEERRAVERAAAEEEAARKAARRAELLKLREELADLEAV